MPHLIVEYSANLENEIDILDLVHKVHQTAVATGEFDINNVRTRAERRDYYVIADGHKDNAFVSVWVHILQGRSPETRKNLGNTIFDAVCKYLENLSATTPIVISLAVQEIDPAVTFRKSNLHAMGKDRAAKAPA